MIRRIWSAGLAVGMLALGLTGFTDLRGSRAKMQRQNAVAREDHFVFAQTPADILRLAEERQLVGLPGSPNYTTKGVSFAYARPEVLSFVERLGTEYRAACAGQPLVITSLVRPISLQPRNASPLSVHPAGMAVDLHVPDQPACRTWLAKRLLDMAAVNVLDVTEERRPHHLHVAVFPRAYTAWLAHQPGLPAAAADAPTPDTRSPEIRPASPRPVGGQYGEEMLVVAATSVAMLFAGVAVGVPLRVRARRRAAGVLESAAAREDVDAAA